MDELPKFCGGWSYTQKEMNTLFKFISYKDDYSILEFGLGNSTSLIYNHFKKNVKNLYYKGYETNVDYCVRLNKDIDITIYEINEINKLILPDTKFDLILIDGPNGEYRSLWYSKLKNSVKEGTIILIDDFNHYESFGLELDKNFEYELLDYYDEGPYIAWGEHSWKIVKIV